jgi:hypothetical protein
VFGSSGTKSPSPKASPIEWVQSLIDAYYERISEGPIAELASVVMKLSRRYPLNPLEKSSDQLRYTLTLTGPLEIRFEICQTTSFFEAFLI